MRARKRNVMVFNPGEPEMYEHAQDTRFRTLVDDISADPSGRGRVPAASPLMARQGATSAQIATAQTQALDELQDNPNASFGKFPSRLQEQGDIEPVPEPQVPAPNGSPTALLSGGRAWKKPEPEVPAWEKGDNEPLAGLEFPPDASADSVQFKDETKGLTKPDYGRVTAEQIAPASAGPKPPGGDKWLAAARGVGSILQSAGGRADLGMQSGLDAYGDYQAQEKELRDYGAKQAELDAQAAKDQRGENRYASETNYGRARDEDSTFRQAGRDAAQDSDRQFQRGVLERGEARDEATDAYNRDPARRQEELDQYRGKKQIDREFAPKRAGQGRAGQAERDMAYRSMMDSAKELYPDGVPTNVQNEIAMRAMDKDPIKASASFIDGIRGESTAASKFETSRTDKQAAAATKAQAAKEEASGALKELQALRKDILDEKATGKTYIPGKEPTAQNVWEGASRVFSRNVGSVYGQGSSGFTPRQQRIQSGGKLVGRGKYLRNQGNSANLKAESDLADSDIMADGSLDGMLQRIDSEIAALGGAIQNNQIVPRDANGNRLDLSEQTPAPDQGRGRQVFTNPEDM